MSNVGRIVLASGRWIELQSLKQSLVYGGLLEGLPTTKMNKRYIDGTIADVQREDRCDPYLVEPVETKIEWREKSPYPFGSPARLPRVCCIGSFRSTSPARDSACDYSSLTLIWFQEDFAFPIDEVVVTKIREVDWNQRAFDGQY